MPTQLVPGSRFDSLEPLGLAGNGLHLRLASISELPHPGSFQLRTSFLMMGNPTYLLFRQAVLAKQIENAKRKGRRFIATLPDTDLEVVEHGQRMKKAAAVQCRALLAAARAKLDGKAGTQSSARALSGYRTVEKEQALWDGYFEKYYFATRSRRLQLPDGEHSAAAVELTANYVSDRKAAPGYGNHSAGIAMDFSTSVGKTDYGASMSQKAGWKKTPFYDWLGQNAHKFHFKPYVNEPWHWEYKP